MEGKKLYKPKFILIHTDIRDNYKLSLRECQMYGYIKYYLDKYGGEFYFTDEDLKPVLGVKSRTPISKAVSILKKKGLIKVRNSLTVKNGQTIKNRFITLPEKLPEVMYSNEDIVMYSNDYINNNLNKNINKENNSKQKELFDDKTSDDGLTIGW